MKIATMRFLNKMGTGVRRESQMTAEFGTWPIGRMQMLLFEIGKSRDEAYLRGREW